MKRGVIAGNFDVIHPGYIHMFNECKKHCDSLHVLLHEDPSIERPEKLKPILSVEERTGILDSLRQVHAVVPYKTEAELHMKLKEMSPDIRFLGDDYIGKSFTGDDLKIHIHYLNRDHGWSTTKYKRLIADSVNRNSYLEIKDPV
jgi:glycerol-3-phosphate cytidylyltransferase